MSEEEKVQASAGALPADGADTKTRKTVRLRPSAVQPQSVFANIADPLSGRDTDTSNLEILEDTQTRRTVKIKPIAVGAPRPVIAVEPGQKTDVPTPTPVNSGADTTTRKTLVLHGATAPATATGSGADTTTRKTLVLRGATAPAAAAPAGGSGADTTTRKTLKLHPAAAPAAAPAQAPVVPAPAPAVSAPASAAVPAPASSGADTTTRKTVKLHPAASLHAPAPAPAPAAAPVPAAAPAPAAEEDTRTRTVTMPKVPATPAVPAEPLDDQTVKIARPNLPPRIGPRTLGKPAAAPTTAIPKPAAAPAPKVEDDAEKQTVKLPQRPAAARPGAIPKPAAAARPGAIPKPAPETVPDTRTHILTMSNEQTTAEETQKEPTQEAPKADKKTGEDDLGATLSASRKPKVEKTADGETPKTAAATAAAAEKQAVALASQPSGLYLVLGLLTLLVIAAATLFSTVHYLEFAHQVKVADKIPGLPIVK